MTADEVSSKASPEGGARTDSGTLRMSVSGSAVGSVLLFALWSQAVSSPV